MGKRTVPVGEGYAAVRAVLEQNPDATVADIVEVTGLSLSHAASLRRRYQRGDKGLADVSHDEFWSNVARTAQQRDRSGLSRRTTTHKKSRLRRSNK